MDNIVSIKWAPTDIINNILNIALEKEITYLLCNDECNGIVLKLKKNDPLFKKFNIFPSKYKTRTYYLSNDDMLIYKLKRDEHPFISISIINNYNNFKYAISFFSRLPLPLHTSSIQNIFKKQIYPFNTNNYFQHLDTFSQIDNNNYISLLKESTIKNFDKNDCLINEGNFLINLLEL